MLRSDSISLHVPEPLALIDATLLFTVQVLIARPPELLLPPEVTVLHPPPGLRAARRLLDGIRELASCTAPSRPIAICSPGQGVIVASRAPSSPTRSRSIAVLFGKFTGRRGGGE